MQNGLRSNLHWQTLRILCERHIVNLLCYISPDVEIRSSVVGLLNTLLGAGVVESFYMSPAAPQADLLTREYSMRA